MELASPAPQTGNNWGSHKGLTRLQIAQDNRYDKTTEGFLTVVSVRWTFDSGDRWEKGDYSS